MELGCLTYVPAIVLGALSQKALRGTNVESVNGSVELMATDCIKATEIDVLRTLMVMINLMRAMWQKTTTTSRIGERALRIADCIHYSRSLRTDQAQEQQI